MNSQPYSERQPSYDDEISMGEIWLALKARFWQIFLVTLLSAIAAVALALNMTPIFRAQVVLAVAGDSSGGGLGSMASQYNGFASLAGINIGGSSSRSEPMGVLNSRQLLETYVLDQKLAPILFEPAWDKEKGDWKPEVKKKPTLWLVTEQFSLIRKIAEDKKAGLVTLSVEWKDPALAAKWANELVALANQTMRQRAIAKSQANLVYLNAQLEKTSVVELREAIFRIIETEVKNVMLAQGSDDFVFKVIDPAVVPEKKVKPKRSLIVVGITFVAFVMSCVFAVIRYRLRNQGQR